MPGPILNIANVELRDFGHGAPPMYPGATPPGEAFKAKLGDIAGQIGAQKLGYGLVVLPPGKRGWPAHSHRVNEEAFFILEGQGEVRIGKETYPVKKGDFIANPPGGPETAHQIRNTSSAHELRYIA
ncbi:MAG: cupin domain-containing protein, partial [Alphaproteobacteria bacterium]